MMDSLRKEINSYKEFSPNDEKKNEPHWYKLESKFYSKRCVSILDIITPEMLNERKRSFKYIIQSAMDDDDNQLNKYEELIDGMKHITSMQYWTHSALKNGIYNNNNHRFYEYDGKIISFSFCGQSTKCDVYSIVDLYCDVNGIRRSELNEHYTAMLWFLRNHTSVVLKNKFEISDYLSQHMKLKTINNVCRAFGKNTVKCIEKINLSK